MDMPERIKMSHPDDLARWAQTAAQLETAARLYRRIAAIKGVEGILPGVSHVEAFEDFFAELIDTLIADWG